MDNTNLVPVIAYLLNQDTEINNLVNGQIIAGLRAEPADPYLTGVNETCIGVSEVSEISTGTPGCRIHGRIDFIADFQIDVISKRSAAFALQISKLCRDMFVGDLESVFGGENFQLRVMSVSRNSWYDPGTNQYHDTVTLKGKGIYWKK